MTSRELLPPRRHSETLKFERDGTPYFLTVGYYADGRPGELFIDTARSGQFAQTVMRDAAIAVSIALQHGAGVDTLRAAMLRNEDDSPAGVMAHALDLIGEVR